MKKINILIITLVLMIATVSCSSEIAEKPIDTDTADNVDYPAVEDTAGNSEEYVADDTASEYSAFFGTWYFTNYSTPSYDDFKPIEIREYGENQAIVDWGDGRTNVIEFISENEARGPYLDNIGDVKYYVKIDYYGREYFNVEPMPGGRIFQPGAGGYRTVPEYFKK